METKHNKLTTGTAKYIGPENLEKITLPDGTVVFFKNPPATKQIEDIAAKHPSIKQYFEL